MSVFDWIIILIWLYMAWSGYHTGLVMQVFRIVTVFIAFWAAKTYGPAVSLWIAEKGLGNFTAPPSLSPMLPNQMIHGSLGFLVVFFVSIIVLQVISRMVDSIFLLPGLSLLNRLAGLVVGIVMGVFVLIILVNVLQFLPIPSIQQAIASSRLAHTLLLSQLSGILF